MHKNEDFLQKTDEVNWANNVNVFMPLEYVFDIFYGIITF